MFKIFLEIAMILYTFWLLEIHIGFRILKTDFESSFTYRIVQKQSALIPFLEFLFFLTVWVALLLLYPPCIFIFLTVGADDFLFAVWQLGVTQWLLPQPPRLLPFSRDRACFRTISDFREVRIWKLNFHL